MADGETQNDRQGAEKRERFLASLLQSQWLSEQDLALYQRRLLERIVRHAHAETTRYRDALAVLFNSDRAIDWGRWGDVPILTREEIQDDPEALFARSVPAPAGHASEIKTSGSTGRPIRIRYDQLAGFAAHMLDARFYDWHGIETDRSLALIKSYPGVQNGYPEGSSGTGWNLFAPDANLYELNSVATIDQQIEWLERNRPDYLCSYPSNILEIARTMGASRARKLGLRACLPFGETVSEDMYSIVPDVFGAPLLDRYGCTEIGQVSAQCPVSTRHHVSMENVYLEVLDDNDNPVEPGGLGRVVVTGLYNYSMPFIRYDLGDYVILSAEPCACGRKLTAIDRIVGRTRSLFRFADGSIKFPYIKLVEIMPLLPHRQLQIAQTHPDRIEIRYVPEPGDRAIDPDGLMRLIRRRMHDSLRVDLKEMNEIPRAPSGKFFDYVCELEQ